MAIFMLAVRRALDHPASASLIKRASTTTDKFQEDLLSWGGAALILTFILFIVGLNAIDYTLSSVVATLAMVETPSSAITVSAPQETVDDEAKEHLLETGPAISLVAQKPFTASIRDTLRHLKSQAGRFAPWRGWRVFVGYNFVFCVVGNTLMAALPQAIYPVSYLISYAITGAILAPLHATWTHKVIAMPTNTWFWQRMISPKDFKRIFLAGAFAATAEYITAYITLGVFFLVNIDNASDVSPVSAIFRTLSVFAVFFACVLFIILPAHVTLVRIEASLLPEDQDTIIPFDRTFAGKVTSKLLGGTGAIGFVDAWKSFNWEARRRVLMVCLKAILIESIFVIGFVHLIILEVWLVLGAVYFEYMASQAAKQNN